MKEAAVPKLPQIKRSRRKDNPEARMSIGDHLRELRQRLFVSAAGVMVMTVVGYLVYERASPPITPPLAPPPPRWKLRASEEGHGSTGRVISRGPGVGEQLSLEGQRPQIAWAPS